MKVSRPLAVLMLCGLSVLTCAGTEGPPICATRCGMTVSRFPDAGWSCPLLQKLEDSTLTAFRTYSDDPRLYVCSNLFGYHIKFNPSPGSWRAQDGRLVFGLTWCEAKDIEVSSSRPIYNSLPHEMAHAMQNCAPRPPEDPKDVQHSNWEEDGINTAISHSHDPDGGF